MILPRLERDLQVAANEEPVTSPDQHKPGQKRAARAGAIFTLVILVMFALCGHAGSQEGLLGMIFLLIVAGLIVVWLFADWALRKSGLR
jgi:hypothetical protein